MPGLLLDRDGPLSLRWRYLPQLLPWLARFALASRRAEALADDLATLLARADQAHDVVIQQCGLADLVRPGGWLKVARSEAALLEGTAFARRMMDRAGIGYEILDAPAVRRLEPALAPDLVAGLLLPRNRAVRHPQRYVEGIARTVIERGGRWLQARVRRLAFAGERVAAVVTDKGEVPADLVVLAAGAFSKELAAQAGLRLPLEAERGYHVMLPHPEPTLSRPGLLGRARLPARPDGARHPAHRRRRAGEPDRPARLPPHPPPGPARDRPRPRPRPPRS